MKPRYPLRFALKCDIFGGLRQFRNRSNALLLIGLELERELYHWELSNIRQKLTSMSRTRSRPGDAFNCPLTFQGHI